MSFQNTVIMLKSTSIISLGILQCLALARAKIYYVNEKVRQPSVLFRRTICCSVRVCRLRSRKKPFVEADAPQHQKYCIQNQTNWVCFIPNLFRMHTEETHQFGPSRLHRCRFRVGPTPTLLLLVVVARPQSNRIPSHSLHTWAKNRPECFQEVDAPVDKDHGAPQGGIFEHDNGRRRLQQRVAHLFVSGSERKDWTGSR